MTGKKDAYGVAARDETGQVDRERSERPLEAMIRRLLDGKQTSSVSETLNWKYKWDMSRG